MRLRRTPPPGPGAAAAGMPAALGPGEGLHRPAADLRPPQYRGGGLLSEAGDDRQDGAVPDEAVAAACPQAPGWMGERRLVLRDIRKGPFTCRFPQDMRLREPRVRLFYGVLRHRRHEILSEENSPKSWGLIRWRKFYEYNMRSELRPLQPPGDLPGLCGNLRPSLRRGLPCRRVHKGRRQGAVCGTEAAADLPV